MSKQKAPGVSVVEKKENGYKEGGQVQEDCITVKLRLPGLLVLEVNEMATWIEVVA